MKAKAIKNYDLVATALWNCADMAIAQGERLPVEVGKSIDRALRSCKWVEDISRGWVRWTYNAEKYGWDTASELKFTTKLGYYYQDKGESETRTETRSLTEKKSLYSVEQEPLYLHYSASHSGLSETEHRLHGLEEAAPSKKAKT